jgi:hypothetical protein
MVDYIYPRLVSWFEVLVYSIVQVADHMHYYHGSRGERRRH